MNVKELYDNLAEFIKNNPDKVDDEIYYLDGLDLYCLKKIEIEWDIESIGRYICIE